MVASVELAAKWGLPLNVRKEVVCAVDAAILGSELNGRSGLLRHRRDKSMKLFGYCLGIVALLALAQTGQALLQHWRGLFCFAAGFRQPLFFVLQEKFPCVASFEDSKFEKIRVSDAVRDEILLAAILLPFARGYAQAAGSLSRVPI